MIESMFETVALWQTWFVDFSCSYFFYFINVDEWEIYALSSQYVSKVLNYSINAAVIFFNFIKIYVYVYSVVCEVKTVFSDKIDEYMGDYLLLKCYTCELNTP